MIRFNHIVSKKLLNNSCHFIIKIKYNNWKNTSQTLYSEGLILVGRLVLRKYRKSGKHAGRFPYYLHVHIYGGRLMYNIWGSRMFRVRIVNDITLSCSHNKFQSIYHRILFIILSWRFQFLWCFSSIPIYITK